MILDYLSCGLSGDSSSLAYGEKNMRGIQILGKYLKNVGKEKGEGYCCVSFTCSDRRSYLCMWYSVSKMIALKPCKVFLCLQIMPLES